MKELVVATRNTGKLKEISRLLEGTVNALYSLAEFPELPAIIEDGDTFEQNALKKARVTALQVGKPVIADDSGLCVDALAGRPGIHSARFAGETANDEANNRRLLNELAGIPEERRSASFHCVIALCFPDGSCHTFSGRLAGTILEKPRGLGGFGYDPLFFLSEYNQTLAELPLDVKNRISHRGTAFAKLKAHLLQE
ncbi:MAG TPA: XTP/dITP diphosphatase [Geobacteraceae bacterium]|nr:XTP/dITP diphosphatase [Geobacteraceae bacterium]